MSKPTAKTQGTHLNQVFCHPYHKVGGYIYSEEAVVQGGDDNAVVPKDGYRKGRVVPRIIHRFGR